MFDELNYNEAAGEGDDAMSVDELEDDESEDEDEDEDFNPAGQGALAVGSTNQPPTGTSNEERQVLVQQIEAPIAAGRVGTLRILMQQDASARASLSCGGQDGAVHVNLTLHVQPELWRGRQVGEWTAQEHQQLAMGVTAFGRDWERIQRLMVPSRSELEIMMYTQKHLPNRKQPAPLVLPAPRGPPTANAIKTLLPNSRMVAPYSKPSSMPGRPARGPGSRGGRGGYGRRGSRGGAAAAVAAARERAELLSAQTSATAAANAAVTAAANAAAAASAAANGMIPGGLPPSVLPPPMLVGVASSMPSSVGPCGGAMPVVGRSAQGGEGAHGMDSGPSNLLPARAPRHLGASNPSANVIDVDHDDDDDSQGAACSAHLATAALASEVGGSSEGYAECSSREDEGEGEGEGEGEDSNMEWDDEDELAADEDEGSPNAATPTAGLKRFTADGRLAEQCEDDSMRKRGRSV